MNKKVALKKVFLNAALWAAPWDASDMSSRVEIGKTSNLNAITLYMDSGIIEFDTSIGPLYVHISTVRMVAA